METTEPRRPLSRARRRSVLAVMCLRLMTVVAAVASLNVALPDIARGTGALWGGNRESVRNALVGRDALIPYALRAYRARRRRYPTELARFPVVRLRSQREVDEWLAAVPAAAVSAGAGARPPGRPGPPGGR